LFGVVKVGQSQWDKGARFIFALQPARESVSILGSRCFHGFVSVSSLAKPSVFVSGL
jgi:hypothetical protein